MLCVSDEMFRTDVSRWIRWNGSTSPDISTLETFSAPNTSVRISRNTLLPFAPSPTRKKHFWSELSEKRTYPAISCRRFAFLSSPSVTSSTNRNHRVEYASGS